jgi:hypothetical protein
MRPNNALDRSGFMVSVARARCTRHSAPAARLQASQPVGQRGR